MAFKRCALCIHAGARSLVQQEEGFKQLSSFVDNYDLTDEEQAELDSKLADSNNIPEDITDAFEKYGGVLNFSSILFSVRYMMAWIFMTRYAVLMWLTLRR